MCLDSNHTHDHVLAELEAYAPLVSLGSYCIVSDTIVEDAPEHLSSNRPWGKGNNPKTAVWEYLKKNSDFEMCLSANIDWEKGICDEYSPDIGEYKERQEQLLANTRIKPSKSNRLFIFNSVSSDTRNPDA